MTPPRGDPKVVRLPIREESRAHRCRPLSGSCIELRLAITFAGQIQHLAPRGLTATGALPPNAGLDSSAGLNQGSSGHRILHLFDSVRLGSTNSTGTRLDITQS